MAHEVINLAAGNKGGGEVASLGLVGGDDCGDIAGGGIKGGVDGSGPGDRAGGITLGDSSEGDGDSCGGGASGEDGDAGERFHKYGYDFDSNYNDNWLQSRV